MQKLHEVKVKILSDHIDTHLRYMLKLEQLVCILWGQSLMLS